jgi:hypothetical protein
LGVHGQYISRAPIALSAQSPPEKANPNPPAKSQILPGGPDCGDDLLIYSDEDGDGKFETLRFSRSMREFHVPKWAEQLMTKP